MYYSLYFLFYVIIILIKEGVGCMKIFKKSSILACVYLLIVGIINLTMGYPKHLNISEFAFTINYYIPKITYLIYIVLSIFTLVKLFFRRQILIHKIVSVVLALSGLIQIFVILMYYYNIRIYYKFISYRDFPQIASHIALIIIALLMILISINTFKPFISNKIALISSICVFAFRTVVYLTSTISHTYFVGNARYLINTFIIIFGSILIGLAAFWASYISLKTTGNFTNNSAEKA